MALPARVGLADEGLWGFLRELADAVMLTARDMGSEARNISSAADEAQVDVVLAIGSVFLYPDLVARQRKARRVLWHVEPLPRMSGAAGGGLHRLLPTGRILDLSRRAMPPIARTAAWRRWREQAANVREPLNNLAQLRRHAAAFDRIVIDAQSRAQGALEAGIPVDVVPFGYHPSYAGPIGAQGRRDIDVVALGNVDPVARRQWILAAVEDELRGSNVEVARISGHVYGAARRAVLERARVSVDVHRIPGGYPLYNFILASAAGAALVTEPLIRPEPLVPGVHYVEAPTADLAAAARDLLDDEPRRRRLVEAAQALLESDLDLRRTLPRAIG
jgi:hypothetical protein